MKTGRAAKLFGVDSNTITDWTNRYADFFSDKARGEGRSQREYEPEDLIVLNTIKVARAQNQEWGAIQAKLAAGDLETSLPPEFANISGDQAIVVYTEVSALRAQNAMKDEQIERLATDLKDEREKNAALLREVGKWQALAEYFQEQMDKNGKGD